MKASLTVFFEDPFWVGVFERITNKTIILSAILMAICLLLSGRGEKGVLLFLLPLTIPAVPLRDSAIVTCAAATFAAIQEGQFIRTGRE